MSKRAYALAAVALAGWTLAVFAPSLSNGFVRLDDDHYLYANPAVLGLDLPAIFGGALVLNYHPFTMLGLAIEHRLFGLDPFPYHLDNLLLHVANALLVFALVLRVARGDVLLAFACGALFAVHPLHVEPVAWVSGRKELLLGFFYLLAIHAHLEHRRRSGPALYGVTLLLGACALLSKVTAVTLPVVLLAFDVLVERRSARRALVEQLPLLCLAGIAGWLNILARSHAAAARSGFFDLGLIQRLWFAAEGLLFHASHTFFPTGLSCWYGANVARLAFHEELIGWLALALMVRLCVRGGEEKGLVRWGAVIFAVTLVPTLRIYPFGGDSIWNDRYAYLPSVGLLLVYVIPLRRLTATWAAARHAAMVGVGAALLVFSVQSHERCKIWRDTETLYLDVLEKYPGTVIIQTQLGLYYLEERRDTRLALRAFQDAAASDPRYAGAHLGLGRVFAARSEPERAAYHFERALELDPLDGNAHLHAAGFFEARGDRQRGITHYEEAVRLYPWWAAAHRGLGLIHGRAGNLEDAEKALLRSIELEPEHAQAHLALGQVYRAMGRILDATESYRRAQGLGARLDAGALKLLGLEESLLARDRSPEP